MYNKTGFTLIELLVVVLIIGILAAVALPQYTKAVEKTRAMEALNLIKTLDQAVDAYYLENNAWPKTFDEMAIDIPWTGREVAYYNSFISDVRSNGRWSVQLEGNSSMYYSIQATRLDGPYQGASFMVQKWGPESYATSVTFDKLYCAEFLSGATTFSGDPGDFCQKIIGATYHSSPGAARFYDLPY